MKKLRLVAALAVAALWSDIFQRSTWRKAGSAFKALFGLLGEDEKVSPALYALRLAACERCPFMFSKYGLKTCGSPLDKSLRDVGCWCFLPVACEQRQFRCWGDEQCPNGDFPYGWRASEVPEG